MVFAQGRFHRRRPLRGVRTGRSVARFDLVLVGIPVLALFLGVAFARAQGSEGAASPPPSDASSSTQGRTPRSAATPQTVAPARPTLPPANLTDLAGWLDYQSRGHIAALPEEARLFYRRGLLLEESGARDEAVRLVRGATVLDPTYVAPHLTLASWFLMRDPSQALLQYAAVLDLARENFVLQLALAANALFLGLQSFFLGLLAAALITVWVHQRELRHPWQERLGRILTQRTARLWSWAILILPYFAGIGITLPTVAFLGALWPSLKASGRALFVALVVTIGAAPWILSSMDRMAAPLRDDRGPYWGVPLLESQPSTRERVDALERLCAQHPNNPFLQFGLGWSARRGGALPAAEAGYRRALALWPGNDRVLNNLGNTLAMEGRTDEALDLYTRACDADPSNAAAWFNASQLHTQRYDYRAATEALSRASALNFDMVKIYQSRLTDDGALPLVDQWLAPQTFWKTLSITPAVVPGATSLPPVWRSLWECSGLPFSGLTVLVALIAVLLGLWQTEAISLRACSNCGDVVCRRCAQRRRELALCSACATLEARAESPDFARVLLLQRQRSVRGRRNLLRTALATLIPGYGLLAFRAVFAPLVLLVWAAAMACAWIGTSAPFSYEPRLMLADGEFPVPVQIGLWALLYVVSVSRYFASVVRANAQSTPLPVSSRTRVPAGRRDREAA